MSAMPPAARDGSAARRYLAAAGAALVVAVLAIYWPALGGGFVFDDYPNIVDNTALHVTGSGWNQWLAAVMSSPASELKRPLSMLSFAANHYFTGLDARAMKLTNLGIHAANALLVLVLVRRLLAALPGAGAADRDAAIAVFVAACWALHPINFTAVLLVVQRMEMLSHTFVFAGLWLYVSGRERQLAGAPGWGRILAGLLACTLLGLLCKESAVLLPLYALAIEACVFGFRAAAGGRDRRLYLLFALVLVLPALGAVAWLLPRSMAEGAYARRGFNLAERLLTEPRVVLDYLRWSLLPPLGELSLYHDDYRVSRGWLSPPSTLFAAAMLLALAAVAWLRRRRQPLLALGLFWFLGAQLITASFIPLELVFEHRNYFASLGVCLLLAGLLRSERLARARLPLAALAGVAIVVLFALLTHLRAREWSDPLRLASSEARKRPQSPRATYELGRTLLLVGNYRVDSPYTQQAFAALEHARKVPGSGILPEHGLLILAARTGAPLQPAWWQDMNAKLRRNPVGPQERASVAALTRCAVTGYCRFPPRDMLGMFEAVLSRGDEPEILNVYGDYALNVLGDANLALDLWREASRLRPDVAAYRVAMIQLLTALGRRDEATAEIAALRRSGRLGQHEAAALRLEAALQLGERPR